jgi:hypothetical protein
MRVFVASSGKFCFTLYARRLQAFLDFNREALAKSGADGWRSKMPWTQQQKEGADELKRVIKVFETIPPHLRLRKSIPSQLAR